jgi:hypothetical protein
VPDGRFDVVVDAHRGQPAVRAALSEYEQAAFPRAAEAAGAEDIFDLMLGDNTPHSWIATRARPVQPAREGRGRPVGS